MTQQLSRMRELEEQLRRSERLAALGTMAAGIAHDIRNPLTSISIFSQLITHQYLDPEVRAKFERVVPRELERVQRILEDMLELARPTRLSLETIDVNEAILQTVESFELSLREGGIATVTGLANGLPRIQGDRKKLHRCFGNIIQNATQSMAPGGQLRVGSALSYRPVSPFPPRDDTANETLPFIKVMIADTGHGIPPEVLARIFDPFFSTKEKGVGLGMAIAHRIIEDHNGIIDVSSVVGTGTTFTVLLPVPVVPTPADLT
jgi:signal transduction histidine kinase